MVILVTAITGPTSGQLLRSAPTAAYTGLGAYSNRHADLFSWLANQASLARLKKTAAGLYGERRFLLPELNHFTALAGLPTRSGNFGIKADYLGSAAYAETQLGLAYARSLGGKMDAGIQFNYHGIRIASGYGQTGSIGIEAGLIIHLSERLHAGLHAANPAGGKFGKGGEKLATEYRFGLGYDASEKFLVSTAIIKEEDRPVNVDVGMQYRFIPQLLARAGIASSTSSAWFGFGFMLRSFRLDVMTSYHPQLGFSPGLLFLFERKKAEE